MNVQRRKETLFISNAVITDPVYPRCRVSGKTMYDEQIMSMPSMIENEETGYVVSEAQKRLNGHYFFFVFNFENYYHFLYDTLPYLHFFQEVRKLFPVCKLLVPASYVKPLAFQKETLELFGLSSGDIEIAEDGAIYEFLHVPTSLTHGKDMNWDSASNAPPSKEAFAIWRLITGKARSWSAPKRIYISRRSWIHGQTDNIGTNYTTRRRCLNEDAVKELLEGYGFQEVFCELLTMSEKIYMFQNATHVAGFIGGGMANLLFSPPETQVACIPTPDFLRINTRFQFSMNHTAIQYLDSTELAKFEGPFSPYTRVIHSVTGKIGEVLDWISESRLASCDIVWNSLTALAVGEPYNVVPCKAGEASRDCIVATMSPLATLSETGLCRIAWAEKPVAGFAQGVEHKETEESPDKLSALDFGLNSPFVCDLQNLRTWCEDLNKDKQ